MLGAIGIDLGMDLFLMVFHTMCIADIARIRAAKWPSDDLPRILSQVPMMDRSLKSPIPIPRKLIKNVAKRKNTKGVNFPKPQKKRVGIRHNERTKM